MTNVIDHALKTYARMDVETGVSGASPELLIVMLYDGAISAIGMARHRLEAGDHAGKEFFEHGMLFKIRGEDDNTRSIGCAKALSMGVE